MSYQGWTNGTPPRDWPRVLAMDVGGATANALEWAAQDPETLSLVFYDEVHIITTNMRKVADLALPKMRPEGSDVEYNFLAKVGDYENRIALADMGRNGITFTSAVKHDKNLSVTRLSAYLHPNPKRPFPSWHPQAGQKGSPLLFVTPTCRHLITEIPLQKWKVAHGSKGTGGDSTKDEMDRTVKHDAVDCALYVARIMPAPASVPIPKITLASETRSLQSQLYWADVAAQAARKSESEGRRPYNSSHSGGLDLCKSLLGFSLR